VAGSLAVWCSQDGDRRPNLELHLNIWRDLNPSLFDIGIKADPSSAPQLFFVYIPAVLRTEDVSDLFGALRSNSTLSAIFNDVIRITHSGAGYYIAENLTEKKTLRVLSVDISSAVKLVPINHEGTQIGTVMQLELPATPPSAGESIYFRIRITMKGDLRNLFGPEQDPEDRAFLSTFLRTDEVEIRLNERRNFSSALTDKYPDIATEHVTAIHCFLIRHKHADLARSHPSFNKVRKLETGLWNEYVKEQPEVPADDALIYHWKATSDRLIALASTWGRFPGTQVQHWPVRFAKPLVSNRFRRCRIARTSTLPVNLPQVLADPPKQLNVNHQRQAPTKSTVSEERMQQLARMTTAQLSQIWHASRLLEGNTERPDIPMPPADPGRTAQKHNPD
jgi:hypothetical protein